MFLLSLQHIAISPTSAVGADSKCVRAPRVAKRGTGWILIWEMKLVCKGISWNPRKRYSCRLIQLEVSWRIYIVSVYSITGTWKIHCRASLKCLSHRRHPWLPRPRRNCCGSSSETKRPRNGSLIGSFERFLRLWFKLVKMRIILIVTIHVVLSWII